MTRCRGVTLAEVVVVLLVVAALAALTLAGLGQVRTMARRVGCQANLRQVGMAFLAYAGDHRRCFPADSDFGLPKARSPAWFDRLPDYVDETRTRDGSVFQCPAWRPSARRFATSQPRSLKMNGYLDDDGRPRHYRLGSVGDQSDLLLMVDAVAGETGMGQWGRAVHSAVEDRRHRGRANWLAADGGTVSAIERPVDGDWRAALTWVSQDWLAR